jgi:hypothetical protein
VLNEWRILLYDNIRSLQVQYKIKRVHNNILGKNRINLATEQFELLVNKWMNNVNNPTNAHHPPRSDNKDGGSSSGFDILVGQKPQLTLEDPNRARFGYIQAKINNGTIEGRISNQGLNILDWVIPTGGGYFFSPSIRSLKFILGNQ